MDLDLDSLREVISYLDSKMEESPNRELADVSNYLQKILDEMELK